MIIFIQKIKQMKTTTLQALWKLFKPKEVKPKKLMIIQHLPNGSIYFQGKRISKKTLEGMKQKPHLKVVEIGKPSE